MKLQVIRTNAYLVAVRRIKMSSANTAKKGKDTRGRGRPATGRTKVHQCISIDESIMDQVRDRAFKERMSISRWVSEAIIKNIKEASK